MAVPRIGKLSIALWLVSVWLCLCLGLAAALPRPESGGAGLLYQLACVGILFGACRVVDRRWYRSAARIKVNTRRILTLSALLLLWVCSNLILWNYIPSSWEAGQTYLGVGLLLVPFLTTITLLETSWLREDGGLASRPVN